jgi:hypothetical protein
VRSQVVGEVICVSACLLFSSLVPQKGALGLALFAMRKVKLGGFMLVSTSLCG